MRDGRFILFAAGCAVAIAFPAPSAQGGGLGRMAPPAPPEPVVGQEMSTRPLAAAKDGVTEHSHGDPTDEEQRLLWLMNRARSDPAAEADRIFVDYGDARVTANVDFFINQADPTGDFTRQENHDAFDSYLRQPPFALNATLLTLSRGWSQTQKDTDTQAHPSDLGQYFTDSGYSWSSVGQSIFAFTEDMLHAHAAFAIDWGQAIDAGTGRPGIGHRKNLMNVDDTAQRDYREVGVGVLQKPNPGQNEVGPKIVTIDFARPVDPDIRFVTGVCYADENANGEYDLGEGISGVRIDVESSTFYAITSASGGYAVPLDKDDGQVEITTTPTADAGSAVIGTQAVIGDTFELDPSGGNILLDFLPSAETPQSAVGTFMVSGGTTQDGATIEKTFTVGLFDVDSPLLGDVDLDIDLDHSDRGELLVELRSPAGTTVVLFDGMIPGTGLHGNFDGSLAPRDPLAAFVGEAYQGDWKLRVTDTAGGATGTFGDCTLTVHPAWVRPIHAPRSGAFFTKLKFKDKETPAKDSITLKAEVDVGAQIPATIVQRAALVVRSLDPGFPELFSVDLSQVPSAKLVPSVVKLKVIVNRKETSRAIVTLKVKGLDLPQLPARVRVDLALGDVLVSQQVALVNGVFSGKKTPVEDQLFRVEKLVSKNLAGVKVTTVKGRFSAGGAELPFEGLVEFTLGAFTEKRDVSFFTPKKSRFTYKGIRLSKLVIDTATGTFTAKVTSQEDLVEDGKIRVALRIGNFFGATEIVPNASGPKIKY